VTTFAVLLIEIKSH